MSQFHRNILSFLTLASLTAGATFLEGCSKKGESSNSESGNGGNTPSEKLIVDVPSISGVVMTGRPLEYNVTFHKKGTEDVILDAFEAPSNNYNQWTTPNGSIGKTICRASDTDTCVLTLTGFTAKDEKGKINIRYHTTNNTNSTMITIPIDITADINIIPAFSPNPISIKADATQAMTTISFNCTDDTMKTVKLYGVNNYNITDATKVQWVSQNTISGEFICRDNPASDTIVIAGTPPSNTTDKGGFVMIQYYTGKTPITGPNDPRLRSFTIPYTVIPASK